MLNKKHLLLAFIMIASFTILSAQDWELKRGIFNPSGVPSLTFSQPRFADMDLDGDLDMILSSSDDKPLYLTNTGSQSAPKFSIIDDLFSSIAQIDAEIAVAHDIDGDGDFDIICGGFTGLTLYKNNGNAISASFSKVDSFFTDLSTGRNPVPDFGDLDNDGDLDLVIGMSESGVVKIYTNTGDSSSAIFLESNTTTVADVGLYAYPVLADLDNDGDLDIISGRDGYGFYYYKNTGSINAPVWSDASSVFTGLGTSTYFNSPAIIDINNDGKKDLIYGSYSGPLNYFKNTGTSSTPKWTENTSLFGGSIDIGSASTPTFIDLDHDGDLDMLTGTQMGDIQSYYNTGTKSNPTFEFNIVHTNLKHSIYSFVSLAETNNDNSYDALVGDVSGNIYYHTGSGNGFVSSSSALNLANVGAWSAPRFIDMDNDGDQDIVAGNEDGYLVFFDNLGSENQPLWSEVSNYFDSLDIGNNAAPAFADLDFDGDYDLLAGDMSRKVRYFENVEGTWVEDTTMVEGLVAGQNATPAFADLDGDGDQDLILGAYDGTFTYYENTREVVSIKPTDALPTDYELNSYPNPFNPSTEISFNLNSDSNIELAIFDLAGKKIDVLASGFRSAGVYSFNYMASQEMGSGIYICRLTLDSKIAESRKITLLK